jgi:hypothetical protein
MKVSGAVPAVLVLDANNARNTNGNLAGVYHAAFIALKS